jgi:hypothetical protein
MNQDERMKKLNLVNGQNIFKLNSLMRFSTSGFFTNRVLLGPFMISTKKFSNKSEFAIDYLSEWELKFENNL